MEDGCLKDKLERWAHCPVQNKLGSETEISSKKWTLVPRGKAKPAGEEDGDEDYEEAGRARSLLRRAALSLS